MTVAAPTSLDTAPSVLWKAFDVLDVFTHGRPVLTLSEIARRSGLPKSTTHRILTMLLEVHAVERVEGGFKVGIRMFSMGSLSVDARLRELSLPHLERLRRLTRQTVHLAVLRDGDAIYLEKLPSLLSPQTPALVGGRLPAHRTGVGKALLAFNDSAGQVDPAMPLSVPTATGRPETLGRHLETVRSTGVAWDRDEAARGLSCVAVPVLVGGTAPVAISVAFASKDGNGKVFVNALRETATALTRAAAGVPSFVA